MPSPAQAPPIVIDLSCGTTAGQEVVGKRRVDKRLVGRHAFGLDTRERAVSTPTTSLNPERSTRGRARASRSRNRFEVLLARPIPPAPPASSARNRASLFSWLVTGVQERAAHRVVLADVALAHHDLEQVGPALGGAEHLGAGPQVGVARRAGISRRTSRDRACGSSPSCGRSARAQSSRVSA